MTLHPAIVAWSSTWAGDVARDSLRIQAEEGVSGEEAWARAAELHRTPGASVDPPRRTGRRATALIERLVAYLAEQDEPVTASQVGAALGTSANTVRHHLRAVAVCVGTLPGGGKAAPTQLWVLA